jgi:hypothetical protein
MRWMRTLHACALIGLATACTSPPPSLDRIGEGYVRAALALAQHDPDLVEAWRGSEALIPGPRVPVAGIAADIDDLLEGVDQHANDVGSAVDKARIDYLDAQLRALDFAAGRLLGRSAGLDEQARDEFGIALGQPDPEAVRRALTEIDRLLPGPGRTVERVNALRKRIAIPPDRKAAVMQLALDACRDAVASTLDLPVDDEVKIRFHKNMPWDAFARYEGGHRTTIEINDDGPVDVSRALRLACHEGYAGHHAQHLLIDRVFEARRWPELQLAPGFGRQLLFLEGAAEVGSDLAWPANRRATLYRERLFPAAGLDPTDVDALVGVEELLPTLLPVVTEVARQYLDSKITREHAIERLSNEALIGNPQATLAFIERRRARALVYGEGRRVIYSMMAAKDLASLRALFTSVSAVE